MLNEFSRTELLLGKDAIEKLKNSKIAIFGIGGVGTFVVEGLVRSGVRNFILIDDDSICLTNINRQIHATHKTIGKSKVDVMKERILEISPNALVETHKIFYLPEQSKDIITNDINFIVDAIDTVTAKIDLVIQAKNLNIPIISCMGVGNKMNPLMLEISDISKTSVCPLAKIVRKKLKEANINTLKVVYSKETPVSTTDNEDSSCKSNCICPKSSTRTCTVKHKIPGSISYMPSIAGLLIASEVIKDIIHS